MNKNVISKLCVLALLFTALLPANALGYGQKWDVGRDWTKLTGSGAPASSKAVATSDDGTIIYSVGTTGVYYSIDSGASWSKRDTGITYTSFWDVSTSSDGSIVALVQNGGWMWVSRDFGATWEQRTNIQAFCWAGGMGDSGRGQWLNISMSATGQYIVATECGKLFRSADYGATFTQSNIGTYTGSQSDQNPKISISSDGQRIIIPNSYLNKVYLSLNSGASFTSITALPDFPWSTASVSGDGRTMIAAPRLSDPWVSSDSGATWQVSPMDLDFRYKDWGASSISDDGTYVALTRYGYKIITSDSGGRGWEIRPNSAAATWTGITSTSDGRVMYAAMHTGYGAGVYTSLPTYIYTDYGTVTLLLTDCVQDTSTVTSVQAASVILVSDTASAAAQGDGSTYKYYSETDTAAWGANYTYGSTQDQTTCGYRDMNGTVILSRGRFIASVNPGVLSETSTNTTDFLQYLGNSVEEEVDPRFGSTWSYFGLPCGNLTVAHAASVTTSCTTAIQADYSLLTHTTPVQVRTSSVKTGVLGQPSGMIYTFVKVLKSVIATAPVGTSWVATETFTVTSS